MNKKGNYMSQLEDKLREILVGLAKNLRFGYADNLRVVRDSSRGQQVIEDIVKAVEEAGYKQVVDTSGIQLMAITDDGFKPVMTGQEFYDRFEKELTKPQELDAEITMKAEQAYYALEAAKRVAGIEEPND